MFSVLFKKYITTRRRADCLTVLLRLEKDNQRAIQHREILFWPKLDTEMKTYGVLAGLSESDSVKVSHLQYNN